MGHGEIYHGMDNKRIPLGENRKKFYIKSTGMGIFVVHTFADKLHIFLALKNICSYFRRILQWLPNRCSLVAIGTVRGLELVFVITNSSISILTLRYTWTISKHLDLNFFARNTFNIFRGYMPFRAIFFYYSHFLFIC